MAQNCTSSSLSHFGTAVKELSEGKTSSSVRVEYHVPAVYCSLPIYHCRSTVFPAAYTAIASGGITGNGCSIVNLEITGPVHRREINWRLLNAKAPSPALKLHDYHFPALTFSPLHLRWRMCRAWWSDPVCLLLDEECLGKKRLSRLDFQLRKEAVLPLCSTVRSVCWWREPVPMQTGEDSTLLHTLPKEMLCHWIHA